MSFIEVLVPVVLLLPFFGALCLFILPLPNFYIYQIGLFFSILTFFASLLLWFFFDSSCFGFQFVYKFSFFNLVDFSFFTGIDGLSLFFVILTTFLVPLCFVMAWDNYGFNGKKSYFGLFLLIEFFILGVFFSLDLVFFYVFFEAVLIPIFLLIGFFGGRARNVRASFFLFFYTLVGSLFMLIGIACIIFEVGTTNFLVLSDNCFSFNRQKLLWISFFLSFAVKVPILPVHIWLPEAHVEAPTEGSVILAAVLLKLGTYGIMRFLLCLFPLASFFFRPFVFMLATVGVIYTSFSALRQVDIKRVIAYASVAHINLTLIGLFSFNFIGIEGAVLQMLSHGFVSGALFFCVGVLYTRHHSRLIKYYSGLVHSMPLFSGFFLLFTMGNIALPGTSSFVGEFLILLGIFDNNFYVCLFSATGIVLSGMYSLWLFNRVCYGNIQNNFILFSSDLSKKELAVLVPLAFFVFFIGLAPNFILEPLHCSCLLLVKILSL